MKKYIIFLLFLYSISNNAKAQNLYLIFDINEPDITKDVYKYMGNAPNNPYVMECGVYKIGTNGYCFGYPYVYGEKLDLEMKPNTPIRTMTKAQALALYPNAKNAAQMDVAMQVHVDYDYTHNLPNPRDLSTSATVGYLLTFTNIFVIEYLANNQVKIVEVTITNSSE